MRIGKSVTSNIKNNWVLDQENAPCYTTISINNFLGSKNIPLAPQFPYSPDFSSCNFLLFLSLENYLKGQDFGTCDNIQTAVTDQACQYPSFSTVLTNGRTDHSALWFLKAVTLKETMLNRNLIGIKH